MPKVSDAHLASRRDQILDAATACFARKGVHTTTLRDICAEAGLSLGAVYRYFPSKTEILEAVFARYAEQHRAPLPLADEDPVARLAELLRQLPSALLDPELEQDHRLSLMMLGEGLLDPRLAASYAALNREAAARIEAALEALGGRVPLAEGVDLQSVAQLILAAYQGFRGQRLMDPSLDPGAFGDALALVLRAVADTKKNG